MKKAVIFDVDGTLVDSVDAHARSWQAALAEFDHPVDYSKVRGQIGKGGDQLLREFLDEAEIAERGEAIEARRKEIFRAHHLPGVTGFPGVRELFQRLQRDGARTVLASSAASDELADYKQRAGVEDLVEQETSSNDAEHSKPEPDIFSAALGKAGVPAAAAIVVGDSPWDAIAAHRAGLPTIGLLCGGFPEAELREAGCIAIYRDPADLLEGYAFSPLAA